MTQLEFDHPDFQKPKHAVVSLSGGMDSSTLLLKCIKNFKTVTAISFDYGQKHRVELEKAKSLIDHLTQSDLEIASKLKYRVIKLDGLVELLNSNPINLKPYYKKEVSKYFNSIIKKKK